jgi:hypothetical protein
MNLTRARTANTGVCRHYLRAMTRATVACVLLGAALNLAGCHKQTAPAPAAQVEATTQSDTEPAPAQAQQRQAVAQSQPEPKPAANLQPVNGVAVPALTAQLRIFIQEKGRLPETFAELAGARLDSVPRLERGLAFAIDPTTQEVKIVRQ